MAKKVKKVEKTEVKQIEANYDPSVLLNVEGSQTDLQLAQKHAKLIASQGGATSSRANIAYRGQDVDKYGALQNTIISAQEAIRLSQVVYYRFGLIRNVLDTMAEFTVKDLIFHSKKKVSKQVLEGWADGVDLKSFLEQMALEYYRSGNVYVYRFESTLKKAPFNIANGEFSMASSGKIPVMYTLLDPNLIDAGGRTLIGAPGYKLIIPASEVAAIIQHFKQDPRAIGDLPPEFKAALTPYLSKSGKMQVNADLLINLDPNNLIVIHRKKQPYERYATPFLSGAFEDIEFRQELRNMDKAVARVCARILIHVKVGNENFIPSQNALNAIQAKLANPSTSTYLITDGTVAISQYFPDIGAMLDPKKYEPVTLDIATALGISPAVYGNASANFSNNSLSIKVLVERIQDGKNKILRQFLIPECIRVAKAFNLKNPSEITPELIGVDLTNEIEMRKLYTRLYEVGVLSPKSVLDVFRTDTLPTYDEELDNQVEFKAESEKGLFQPVLNRGGDSPNSGRPTGTPTPQQTKTVKTSPKGSKIKGTMLKAFTADQFVTAKNDAFKYFQNNCENFKEFTQEQASIVDDACAEFLISNNYSTEEFYKFLNTVLVKE